MKIHALAIITALALPALALADDKAPTTGTSDKNVEKPTKLSEGDVAIIEHLHRINQQETDLGKMAKKDATTNVKNYGDTLVNDHQNADKELTALAKRHGLHAIPAEKPQTEAEKQEEKGTSAQVAHLKTVKGAEFDREFLALMVNDHDKVIAWVETSIGAASDPDLKALLTSLKPVLQRHAEEARNLQKAPAPSTK